MTNDPQANQVVRAPIHDEPPHPEPTSFWRRWVFSTNHKMIGKQYMMTSIFFLFVGGFLAMLMRWQLAYPWAEIPLIGKLLFPDSGGSMPPEFYIMLVTLHGTIMVFFVVAPLLVGGFGNFLIPLQVGARDMAFPVLNMISYWVFFLSGAVVLTSLFVTGGGAAGGWTVYPPLSVLKEAVPGSGLGMDLWILALGLMWVALTLGSLNFLATIINMRAPGMSWFRLPLLTWAQFVVAVLLLLSFPVAAAGLIMMEADRLIGTSFFLAHGLEIADMAVEAAGGGSAILWQHIFWFLGHPEVYVLILPAMGIVSEILPVFSRKPIFGYKAMVVAMVSIMGLGFIVWAHHMFQAGLNPLMAMAFMTATMMIALPSGVKVFNWLATLWRGSLRFETPMLFALAFVSLFIIGGLTGIFMAALPVDIHIHDTYFIIAHFHYIVFGGSIFAIFGAIHFWFPKMFGRLMSESAGKIHFALTFLSFNAVFFPMHMLGSQGHLRRIADPTVYDYLRPMQDWNVFITLSAFVLGAAQLIFLWNFVWSIFRGKRAEANPWRANTLEWSIASPAPSHNFEEIPTVHRWPYEYSSNGGGERDWIEQAEPITVEASGPVEEGEPA
ncbi:MAG: cbb3-type cytochrome c oxidase subunit I [Candidatus Krumholzibacteria bacterium]